VKEIAAEDAEAFAETQRELQKALDESRDNYQVLMTELQKIVVEHEKLKELVSGYIPAESEDAPVEESE